jgi:hypothetical protein
MRLVFRRRREERKIARLARLLCELDARASLERPKEARRVTLSAVRS